MMLVLDQVSKRFDSFEIANVTLRVNRGDYFILLGPSGAGKSVLLKILVGLIKPDGGRILLNGSDITGLPVGKRNLGILFQDLALFPHLNVFDNIAFPMKVKGYKRRSILNRVEELASSLSVSHLLNRKVYNLSGGEQQRVTLARTMALNPKVLLLDEPLSAVDSDIHLELMALLRRVNRNGTTIIHVTHSFEEAISLANRVGVINNGRLVQIGNTLKVFQNPINRFVARFTGAKNFFKITDAELSDHGLVIGRIQGGAKICYYTDNLTGSGYVQFPESAVVLSENLQQQSALNVYQGRVVDLFAQPFGYEVVLDCGVRIHAHITWESKEKLHVIPGVQLFASIKANSVKFIPEI